MQYGLRDLLKSCLQKLLENFKLVLRCFNTSLWNGAWRLVKVLRWKSLSHLLQRKSGMLPNPWNCASVRDLNQLHIVEEFFFSSFPKLLLQYFSLFKAWYWAARLKVSASLFQLFVFKRSNQVPTVDVANKLKWRHEEIYFTSDKVHSILSWHHTFDDSVFESCSTPTPHALTAKSSSACLKLSIGVNNDVPVSFVLPSSSNVCNNVWP